jgi:hypothetical protein
VKLRSQRFISPITLWLGNPGLIRSGSQTRACDPQGPSVHKVGREALATLFHRLHFGWATRGLFVLEVRGGQVIRWNSRYIGSAVRTLANFISPITLWLGNPGFIRSGSQTRAGDPQGQSVHKVGRKALAIFISPITL